MALPLPQCPVRARTQSQRWRTRPPHACTRLRRSGPDASSHRRRQRDRSTTRAGRIAGDSKPTPRRALSLDRVLVLPGLALAVQCGEKLRAWKVSGSLFARHGRLGHAREGITNAARHGCRSRFLPANKTKKRERER